MPIGYDDYIEEYFQGQPSAQEKSEFEAKIAGDPVFADQVAFYLSLKKASLEMLYEEKKSRFREIYNRQNVAVVRPINRTWLITAVAASIVVIFAAIFFFVKPSTPDRLADEYIKNNLSALPVTMGKEDSLQKALNLYNQQKWNESVIYFEKIIQGDSANAEVLKYSGIAHLRTGNYDKALLLFRHLDEQHLEVNPGKFLQAVTLMKRNQEGDKKMAKDLLEQVANGNLEGKETARSWLKDL